MTIETHAADRKALAHAIAAELGTEARYTGAPSFSFQAGPYTVDRAGNIIGDDFTALHDFLIQNGYITEEPAREELPSDSEALTDDESQPGRMDISVPAPNMSVTQVTNLVYILYSKQHLISRMTQGEILNVPDVLVTRLKEYSPESLEEFTQMLDDARATSGLDGFDFRDGQFTMSFPFCETEPQRWTTYAELTGRILQAAKEATRVYPEKQEPENEKYFARIWLLRLGYGGVEMKTQRDILLKHLHGYSAFPNDEAAKKHKEKYADIRAEKRLSETEAAVLEVMADD